MYILIVAFMTYVCNANTMATVVPRCVTHGNIEITTYKEGDFAHWFVSKANGHHDYTTLTWHDAIQAS